ncbi:uncharacterized protein LOC109519575 [Hippocampus comes]|uniref:uncharacterized protein LOC109519575 n=1 Tax=Hippocampus comes TaxID=109280 RepID=UPI00094E670B|nr:PREDICTED: uncharacterized protein LOC109519575 [Hippocampus comes]
MTVGALPMPDSCVIICTALRYSHSYWNTQLKMWFAVCSMSSTPTFSSPALLYTDDSPTRSHQCPVIQRCQTEEKSNLAQTVSALFRATERECESLAGRTGIPQGYWSFSWVAEDELSFPNNWKPVSDPLCDRSKICDQSGGGDPEFTWNIVATGDTWTEHHQKTEKRAGSPQGWEEGQFFWVNGSSFGGPWVLSPWLRSGPTSCSIDMALYLNPKQSGQYTIWLIERDKPQLALFSTDTLPPMTG